MKRRREPLTAIAHAWERVHLLRIWSRALTSRGMNVEKWELLPSGNVVVEFRDSKLMANQQRRNSKGHRGR